MKLADDILEGAEAAADWTGFQTQVIYRLVRSGEIPHTRRGNILIFRKSELNHRFSSAYAPPADSRPDPQNGSGIIVTAEEMEAAKSPRGGWTAKTLRTWGVPWPPPKGWRQKLLRGEPIA